MKFYDESLESLSGLYSMLVEYEGIDPKKITKRKEKIIRRRINDSYFQLLKGEHASYLGDDVPATEILNYLTECHEKHEALIAQKLKHQRAVLKELFGESADTIDTYDFVQIHGAGLETDGSDIKLCFRQTDAYKRTIVFKNAYFETKLDNGWINDSTFSKAGDGYLFEFIFYDCDAEDEDEIEKEYSFTFSSAELESTVYDPTREGTSLYPDNPWECLELYAGSIVDKSEQLPLLMNDEEKELIPVLSFLSELTRVEPNPKNIKEDDWRPFAEIAVSMGFDELSVPPKTVSLFHKKLSDKKYEPLWRYFYSKLVSSQSQYPSRSELLYDEDILWDKRRIISETLYAQGFEGEYPNFSRVGDIKGVKLISSYDMSYFVANEKQVSQHIRCFEETFDEFDISFICGYQSASEGPAEDIFSCMFEAKGKRYFTCFSPYYDGEEKKNDLEAMAKIAVKKTELKQRGSIRTHSALSGNPLLLLAFLFMGLLFGGLFTPLMMLICVIVEWVVTGSFGIAVEALSAVDWLGVFLFAVIGFGGSMAIVELMSRKK